MPYSPINKCLPATEDIRVQHRCSAIVKDLSRTTHFNKAEIMRLFELHYVFTTKRNRTMDRVCFVEFMDTFLDFRNVDAIEKMHELRCKTNKTSLTEREFVELLSLLLKGHFGDVIKFCFDVYLEMLRMSTYIRRDDVLLMARRNSQKFCKLDNSEEYDTNFVTFVMAQMDKDRDDRISYEDYRKSVYEDVARLQFLGQILPTCAAIESFVNTFSARPYTYNLEAAHVMQFLDGNLQEKTATIDSRRLSTMLQSMSDNTRMTSSSFDSDSTQQSGAADDALYGGQHATQQQAAKNVVTSLLGR